MASPRSIAASSGVRPLASCWTPGPHARLAWLLAALAIGLVAAPVRAEMDNDFDPFETANSDPFETASYDPFDATASPELEAPPRPRPIVYIEIDHGIESENDPFADPSRHAGDVETVAYQTEEESLPGPTEQSPAVLPDGRTDPDAPEADIPLKSMCELTTNITLPGGLLPRDYAYERPLFVPECFDPCARTRFWPVASLEWQPSCLTHNPLYFEEINVERYGYACGCYGDYCSTCVQSAASGAHFFATIPALPYMMATDCPTDCVYTLGHYRPGSCPPWRPTCNTRPSWEGVAATAGVATGIIFLVP